MSNLLSQLSKSQRTALLAIIFLVICAFFYSPLSPDPAIGEPFLLAGCAVFFVALFLHKPSVGAHRRAPLHNANTEQTIFANAPYRWWHYLLTLAGAFCLWLMAQGGSPVTSFNPLRLFPMDWHLQFGLFVLGAVLVAMGLGNVFNPTPAKSSSRNEVNPTPATKLVSSPDIGEGVDHGMPKSSPSVGGGGATATEGVKLRSPIRHHMPLLMIIVLGFILRVWNLENAVHYFVDEGHFVDAILRLWSDPTTPILGPMNYIATFTYMQAVPQTFTVDLFGTTLTGMRMMSVMIGTMTIPAVYLLARALFDRPTALLAGLLLATFPPHLHFSRLALNNVTDPFFGTLALGFFAWGVRSGGRMNFALAGICLGMTQYFYEGGKLVFPAVMALWVVGVMIGRIINRFTLSVENRQLPQKTGNALKAFSESHPNTTNSPFSGLPENGSDGFLTRRNVGNLAIFILATILIMFPQYDVLSAWDMEYITRLTDERLEDQYWRDLLVNEGGEIVLTPYIRQQLSPALLHYIQRPDDSTFYYGGHTALILPLLVPAFLLGVVWILWRRRIGEWCLLFILLFTALGNSLLIYPDWTARFVVTFPALVIITAVGLRYTWGLMTSTPESSTSSVENRRLIKDGKRTKGVTFSPFQWTSGFFALAMGFQPVAYTVIVLIALMQVVYYFGPHLAVYNQQVREDYDSQDVGWRSRDFPAGTVIYLFSNDPFHRPHFISMEGFWDTRFELIQVESYDPGVFDVNAIPDDVDVALYVKPDDAEILALLRTRYDLPEPQFSPYNVPDNQQYALYYIDNTP